MPKGGSNGSKSFPDRTTRLGIIKNTLALTRGLHAPSAPPPGEEVSRPNKAAASATLLAPNTTPYTCPVLARCPSAPDPSGRRSKQTQINTEQQGWPGRCAPASVSCHSEPDAHTGGREGRAPQTSNFCRQQPTGSGTLGALALALRTARAIC